MLVLIKLLLFTITTAQNSNQSQTAVPSTTDEYTPCLNLNRISLNGTAWPSRMRFSKTEGIFYVYNADDALNTFKSLSFPISKSWPISLSFNDDESSVGCWTGADFSELNIRFKVYQFYHTAMKAVSILQIPNKTASETTFNMTLNTLPYEYSDVSVTVEFTLKWTQQTVDDDASPIIYSEFDSDEITNEMMTDHRGTFLRTFSILAQHLKIEKQKLLFL